MNTQLMARLTVDGSGDAHVATGLPALDHLLGVLAHYARFDLALEVAPGSPQVESRPRDTRSATRSTRRFASPAPPGTGSAPSRPRRRLPRSRSISPTVRASSPTSIFPAFTSGVSAPTSSQGSSTSWRPGRASSSMCGWPTAKTSGTCSSRFQGARRGARGGVRAVKDVVRTEAAPAPFQGAPYSQAIISGGFVFVSGQLSLRPDHAEIFGETIQEQTSRSSPISERSSRRPGRASTSWSRRRSTWST